MTKSLPPTNLVLYADDDRDDIELVKEAFYSYSQNIELVTFEDGLELLNYLKKIKPNNALPCLIILDINMPVLNGKEALKSLRSFEGFENVPVVLFSTSTLPSEATFAKSFDAGFVNKPLHTEQIHQLVEQMVEHCSEEAKWNLRRFRSK